jgi:hypothetical protein
MEGTDEMTSAPEHQMIQDGVSNFDRLTSASQQEYLKGILSIAAPDAITGAVRKSDIDRQRAAAKGAFDSVPQRDRKILYLAVICVLAVLAASALVAAGMALASGRESAAFFTFAGLALGGITGLVAPSPTSGQV